MKKIIYSGIALALIACSGKNASYGTKNPTPTMSVPVAVTCYDESGNVVLSGPLDKVKFVDREKDNDSDGGSGRDDDNDNSKDKKKKHKHEEHKIEHEEKSLVCVVELG